MIFIFLLRQKITLVHQNDYLKRLDDNNDFFTQPTQSTLNQ